MSAFLRRAMAVAVAGASAGCTGPAARPVLTPEAARTRVAVLARARVWTPARTRSLDLRAGPGGPGAFAPGETVRCTYVDAQLAGKSPKFICRIREGDEVKVKYGATNGEVFGETLATRLLWALGFGADRMYPVAVVCRGCPAALGGTPAGDDARRFDPAVVERKMPGREWSPDGSEGWAWNELNVVNPALGGAPRAHRDALTLLAVFMQHTDSKPQQQRILCLGEDRASPCGRPFLMISDVGLTFGRANAMNANEIGSVNLAAWRTTPIWTGDSGCRGNLPKSLTGSLDDPLVGEEGRRFLARLLGQLSDRQLRDLFAAARVESRLRSPGDPSSGYPTAAEWVDAFKAKRAQIASRRCH
jgi:hypothetical protein